MSFQRRVLTRLYSNASAETEKRAMRRDKQHGRLIRTRRKCQSSHLGLTRHVRLQMRSRQNVVDRHQNLLRQRLRSGIEEVLIDRTPRRRRSTSSSMKGPPLFPLLSTEAVCFVEITRRLNFSSSKLILFVSLSSLQEITTDESVRRTDGRG